MSSNDPNATVVIALSRIDEKHDREFKVAYVGSKTGCLRSLNFSVKQISDDYEQQVTQDAMSK